MAPKKLIIGKKAKDTVVENVKEVTNKKAKKKLIIKSKQFVAGNLKVGGNKQVVKTVYTGHNITEDNIRRIFNLWFL
jgi:hypothetical protein